MKKKPESIDEVIDFYYDRYKPLYGYLQSIAKPSIEMAFEINAAFDHLSRYWKYNQNEEVVIDRVCGHMKRACFDGYKIVLKETVDCYNELKKIDLSIIDNGEFEKNLIHLFSEIKQKSDTARAAEGGNEEYEKWHEAFDLWEEVYVKCLELKNDYYLCKHINWAKKKNFKSIWRQRFESIIIGVLSGIIVFFILQTAQRLFFS